MTRGRRKRMGLVSQLFSTARPGEVYGYRTLRPSGRGPRHWAYVGKTRFPAKRHRQHMGVQLGTDCFPAPGQPWNDLDPKRYVLWKSRKVRGWRLSLMEFLVVRLLMPVYNDKMNRGNPRRIPLYAAKRQRRARDAGRWARPTLDRARWGFRVVVMATGVLLILVGTVAHAMA